MAENPFLWSITASNNDDADAAVPWPEGMAPSAVNNSARGIMAAVARYIADTNGTLITTGSSNAYAVTSNCPHTAYTDGILITAKANFTNTAQPTLNLNGLGAKAIRYFSTQVAAEDNPSAGQILIDGTYHFRYSTAANVGNGGFILLNPTPDPTISAQIGEIRLWSGSSLPTGFLWPDGSAVSRSTYFRLFNVIGEVYGAGDGSTTFNLPDLRGRVPFGSDNLGGSTAGRIFDTMGGGTLGGVGGAEHTTLITANLPVITPAGTISQITPAGSISQITPAGSISQITPSGSISQITPSGSVTPTVNGGSVVGTLHATINNGTGGGFDVPITTATLTVSATFSGNAVTPTFTGNAVTPTFTGSAVTPTFSGSAVTPTFTGTSFGNADEFSNVPPGICLNYIIKY